jgi:hypothetical protein
LVAATAESRPLDALAAGGLTEGLQSTAVRAALDDPRSQVVVSYLVDCALGPGQSVQASSANGQWSATLRGRAGFAPRWLDEACDVSCQRWVSACLLSRVNAFNASVLVSQRVPPVADGTTSPLLQNLAPAEKVGYPQIEAAFWGNYWEVDPATGRPRLHACAATGGYGALEKLRLRVCGDATGFPCASIVIGHCSTNIGCPYQPTPGESKTCSAQHPDSGAIFRCNDDTNSCDEQGTAYTEVVTVFRAPACSHPDYVSGAPLKPDCSPCAKKIASMNSSCTTSAWSPACVSLARQFCAAHDVLQQGAPLRRGTADVVDKVCGQNDAHFMARCCKIGWDQGCVAAARATYGI